jgi:hypothetical protein
VTKIAFIAAGSLGFTRALARDILTSLAEIRDMVNLMFEQNRPYLPQFRQVRV